MKIVLLEDEAIVIRDIKARLNRLGYEVTAAFNNGEEFLDFMDNNDADMCLIDINIKGEMNGIDTVNILQKNHNIPVIYLTAQGDRETFLQAKNTKPAAYLLKPYNEFELQASIELAIENFEQQNNSEDKELKIIEDKVFFKYKERFECIKVQDVLFLEASGNYTTLHIQDGKSFLLVSQLGKFEAILQEKYIFRCHRSFIINLHKIDGFDDSHLYIGESQIPISKTYKKEFLNRLRII
jgi:DNA-binding LytR/AlgR family response regulator